MNKILLTILSLFIGGVSFCQNAYSVNDSTSVGDTLKLLTKDSTEIQGPSFLKKARRISPTADLRSVDGLFLGLSYRIKGYKAPDPNIQKITVLKSIRTKALIFEYKGEWISVFKNTDITLNGLADIKGNILNFFGRGNDTDFDQSGDFRTFYRVNFSFYQIEPTLRIRLPQQSSISFGPTFQHFVFDPKDNGGRYINELAAGNQLNNLSKEKSHAGVVFSFMRDTRNDLRMPTEGVHFSLRLQAFEGLNKYSETYAQAFPQFSFYKSLDTRGGIVLANRVGAGFTIGKTAFYQSAFLGSQDNLLGYRKFRFAADHLVYNNLETRITLPRPLPILKGKAGLIVFYDIGRVWIPDEVSKTIHHGYGAGVFLNPFNRFFVRAVAGFSSEGMQPTVALRQRF